MLIEGNGRDLSMLKDSSIDCILTDHPWLDVKSNKGGTRAFALYDCFRYTLEDFKEKARVLKDGCFLVEVLPAENENNYEYLYQIKKYAKEAGFIYYSKVPWKKGTFVSNTGRKAKNTQDIMIFSKGKARNMRYDKKKSDMTGEKHYMSGCKGMLPTMFDVQPVARKNKIHQSELPVELCEKILEYDLQAQVVMLPARYRCSFYIERSRGSGSGTFLQNETSRSLEGEGRDINEPDGAFHSAHGHSHAVESDP